MRLIATGILSLLLATTDVVGQVVRAEDPSGLEDSGVDLFQSKSTRDPNKAALYAAILPGLGQIYNRQYWKLPILYGGAIAFGHYIKFNHDLYNAFRNAYISETDSDPATQNPFTRFDTNALQRNAEQFRRNRDYVMILAGIYYLLNIVDAHVSAHLSEFNVNDDLALEVRPAYYQGNRYTAQNIGVSLVFSLK